LQRNGKENQLPHGIQPGVLNENTFATPNEMHFKRWSAVKKQSAFDSLGKFLNIWKNLAYIGLRNTR